MNIALIGTILLSLDSSHHDESNGSKIIPIRAIFVEIALSNNFCKNFGLGRVGYPNHRVKFGALNVLQLAQKNSQRLEKLESMVNEKINEVLTKLEELKQSKYENKEIKEKGRKGKGKKAKNEFYQVNIYFIIIFFVYAV